MYQKITSSIYQLNMRNEIELGLCCPQNLDFQSSMEQDKSIK